MTLELAVRYPRLRPDGSPHLGHRLNLTERPNIAIVAVTHALTAQVFYAGADVHVVGIQPVKTDLTAHADGIEDTPAGKARADCHASWARRCP
jgi:ParB family transcriptional regulator, chromosome partitioning protein